MYRIPTRDKETKVLLDPHVVIIGAGASKASCLTDKNGRRVPLLRNIHKILELTDTICEYGFQAEDLEDFEAFFSSINDDPAYEDLRILLENEIRKYFQKLQIPAEPTLYDYLILSLSEKDAIISFNWDPFLLQAYRRNISVGNLPKLFFPHGNVGVGICYECHNKGYANCVCPTCGSTFSEMPLLFPVKKKNYWDNSIIEAEWAGARDYLKRAAGLTIYGYSAPSTDVEAYELLKGSFSQSNVKDIAPVTIINRLENKDKQLKKWESIYSNRMISYCATFEESLLWQCPRTSLETIFDAILFGRPREMSNSYKKFDNLVQLQQFVLTINGFRMGAQD